jgi:hypothetical protein
MRHLLQKGDITAISSRLRLFDCTAGTVQMSLFCFLPVPGFYRGIFNPPDEAVMMDMFVLVRRRRSPPVTRTTQPPKHLQIRPCVNCIQKRGNTGSEACTYVTHAASNGRQLTRAQ